MNRIAHFAAITTLTTLATLPWILKFLVAPVVDLDWFDGHLFD